MLLKNMYFLKKKIWVKQEIRAQLGAVHAVTSFKRLNNKPSPPIPFMVYCGCFSFMQESMNIFFEKNKVSRYNVLPIKNLT